MHRLWGVFSVRILPGKELEGVAKRLGLEPTPYPADHWENSHIARTGWIEPEPTHYYAVADLLTAIMNRIEALERDGRPARIADARSYLNQ